METSLLDVVMIFVMSVLFWEVGKKAYKKFIKKEKK